MDKRLEEKLFDRLAELTKGDGGRFMAHLETVAASENRQAKFEARKRAEGYQRIPIWVHRDELPELKAKYPGPRGGVDWQAVLDAALKEGFDQ